MAVFMAGPGDTPSRIAGRGNSVIDEIIEDIKESISTPYPPASRPGQPPHLRSGRLRASVTKKQVREGETIRWEVTVTAPYAGFLEHGTSRMAARPFIGPALKRARRKLAQAMRKEFSGQGR